MPRRLKCQTWQAILAIGVSALALNFAFPQVQCSLLAFVALIPLLWAIEGASYRRAFWLGYLFGFIFFFATVGWFIYVTYPGAFVACAYLALYPAVFAVFTRVWHKHQMPWAMFALAAFWTLLEWARSYVISGFSWVSLGHSQYQNLWLIQIAEITGLYGVSFLVILINAVLYEVLFLRASLKGFERIRPLAIVLAIVVGVLVYGMVRMNMLANFPTVRVAVIQPNIAQADKWEPRLRESIVDETLDLTRQASQQNPDVIIWPETSLPAFLWEEPALVGRIKEQAKQLKTPILFGAITQEGDHYFNSALMVSNAGEIAQQYNKIHLVPFGEYLPWRPVLGWINRFVALEDFTPGQEYVVFNTIAQKPFGVLICFEDTVAYIRRNFVKAGARFFVNMTNDAWFEDTKAPFLHMQAAIFGSIENRRSLVRAANTGVSAMIDPLGHIIETVHDSKGKKSFIKGVAVATVPVVDETTFYTKYADLFTFALLIGIIGAVFQKHKTQ